MVFQHPMGMEAQKELMYLGAQIQKMNLIKWKQEENWKYFLLNQNQIVGRKVQNWKAKKRS